MKINIKNIFKQKIIWKLKEKNDLLFEVDINGELFFLKINDFPEESMYTVTNNYESIDFDDKPECWEIII